MIPLTAEVLAERVAATQDRIGRIEVKLDAVTLQLADIRIQIAEARSAWRTGLAVAAGAGSVVGALVAIMTRLLPLFEAAAK